MLGKLTEGSEKRSEGSRMTPIAQASRMMRDLAEPRPVGDTVKAAITRAARAVSSVLQEPMRYGRAEDIWRQEARRIDAAEMDAIRAAHERRHRSLRDQLREAEALAGRLERLAAELSPAASAEAAGKRSASARQAQRTARALRDLARQRAEGLMG